MLFSAFPALSMFFFTLTHIPLTLANTSKITSKNCSCYRTNGTSPLYFTHHYFLDFRSLPSASSFPPLITNASLATAAGATSPFFDSEAWTNEWAVQNWNNSDSLGEGEEGKMFMVNTANNVYIEQNNNSSSTNSPSHLTLRTARHPTFQSAAEIVSTSEDFHYLSLRLLARVIGSPGACAGIYTYLAGSSPASVQEADIEILTRGPRNRVQFTNQPSTDSFGTNIPQATFNGTVSAGGGKDWSEWNIYRLDWSPKKSTWFVNGEEVAELTFQVPRDPSAVIFNMWSDGGVWTGNMSVYDQAYLQIRWIEVVHNTSFTSSVKGNGRIEDRDESEGEKALENLKEGREKGCDVVCGVDEMEGEVGTPVVLFNNTGDARARRAGGMGGLGWLSLVLVGVAVFGYV